MAEVFHNFLVILTRLFNTLFKLFGIDKGDNFCVLLHHGMIMAG